MQPTTFAKLGVTAVGVAAVGLVGLTLLQGPAIGPAASPSPTASPSPVTPPPLTERFESPLHRLSIAYPAGWQTRPATEPWGHDAIIFGASDVDVIFDPTLGGDLYIALASEPLDGRSAGEWDDSVAFAEICGVNVGPGGGRGRASRIDGVDAFVTSLGCGSGGAGRHEAVFATATRGYVIQSHLGAGVDDSVRATYDAAWFEALLKSVDLRPAPPFTERFDSPLHGISIDYPSGWQVRPATEPWTDQALTFDSPAADVISDPAFGTRLYFTLASQPYGDVRPDDWDGPRHNEYCRTGEGGAGVGGGTVDGVDAHLGTRCRSHFAEPRTATRGYVIFLRVSDEALGEDYGWAWFEAAIETVDLRPEDAR
jgi:hypothetical protein